MKESEQKVREFLARIGARGGQASRRELTRQHAKKMVAIREAKRAALKAGKTWPQSIHAIDGYSNSTKWN